MGDFRAVRSGIEIGMDIADLLEQAAPTEFNGTNRAITIRKCNDVLQDRSDMSIDMLYDLLVQKCSPNYTTQLEEIKQDMQAFFHQHLLRTWRYTMTGNQTYPYQVWNLNPQRPLKIIDQQIFDHAAEHGFPSDFFIASYFDHVTIYCMPDGADCSFSHFQDCRFSVCGIRSAVFDHAEIYDTDFHSALLQMVNFTEASIVRSHFRDSELASVSFQDTRLKFCLMVDCTMNRVDFRRAVMDGTSFGRIDAKQVLNLPSVSIVQGGATPKEIRQLHASIYRELGVPLPPIKRHPQTNIRWKTSMMER